MTVEGNIPKQFIHTMFQDSTNDEGDEFRPKMILFLLPLVMVIIISVGVFPRQVIIMCVLFVLFAVFGFDDGENRQMRYTDG